jgi:hypothetical protein
MAVSAAFPVGIGPFRLYVKRLTWWKKPKWNAPAEEEIPPPSDKLHFYDGGVYDNLGLEPLFNAGTGQSQKGHRVIASDAGAHLWRGFGMSALNPFRLKLAVMLSPCDSAFQAARLGRKNLGWRWQSPFEVGYHFHRRFHASRSIGEKWTAIPCSSSDATV